MYEVSHTPDIVQFQPLDLSGDAKQTSHVRNTSAPLFFHFLLVSELLYELLLLEMLYELHKNQDLIIAKALCHLTG